MHRQWFKIQRIGNKGDTQCNAKLKKSETVISIQWAQYRDTFRNDSMLVNAYLLFEIILGYYGFGFLQNL